MAENRQLIEIQEVTKTYGVVRALTKVSFSIDRGEIHTILGENGAGKSTLMKIISGEQAPTSGQIVVDGAPMKSYSPTVSQAAGIYMVHQELAIFENMTVAENMFPNFRQMRGGRIDKRQLHQRTQEMLDLFGLKTIHPAQPMASVTLGGQQMVEILRCIAAKPRAIILDEPTSGLNDSEAEHLMAILRKLKGEGVTILYISHRLKEIMEISDRVSVLRDGQYINTFNNSPSLTEGDLINSMVGRDLSAALYTQKSGSTADNSAVLLEAKALHKKNVLRETSLSLHKGEVVGVFGLEGCGMSRLSRMLYGLEKPDGGHVLLKGQEIRRPTPRAMVQNKVMYLNNNRKIAGLLLHRPVGENIPLSIQKEVSGPLGVINRKKRDDISESFVKSFSIALPSLKMNPVKLSGGNQQKVMLSACLAPKPQVLIVNEPTRGVDVGAKSEIHNFLLAQAAEGVGVLIFSSEMPELMKLCDRILVMRNGAIVADIPTPDFSEQTIMRYAAIGEMQ